MASMKSAFKSTTGVVSLVVLFSSFALMAVGEWGPSIGMAGLLCNLCMASAFLLFAVAIAGFVLLLVESARSSRSGAKEDFSAVALKLAHETLRFLVAAIVYGGSVFIALGVLVAFGDDASPEKLPVAFAVWAVCIGAVVLYRRYRKRHPVKYEMLSSVAISLLVVLFMLGALFVGAVSARETLVDLLQGPKTELCWLAEVDEERATGRYSGFRQDTIELTFETLDERSIFIEVAESDRPGLSDIVAAEGVVWLTYFPESGVFVSAEPGMDDYVAAGGE